MPTAPRVYLSSSGRGRGHQLAMSGAPGTSIAGSLVRYGRSPMSTSSTIPACVAAGPTTSPGFRQPKHTVTSARTAGPARAPVSTSIPLGTSTATVVTPDRASTMPAAGVRSPGLPPMPTMPSTTRSIRWGRSSVASITRPPPRHSAPSPPRWTFSGESSSAVTAAPRLASRAPAYRASPPLSPDPTSTSTAEPYTRGRRRAQRRARPAAARCINVPGGSFAMSAASASRTVSTRQAPRMSVTLRDHHRRGDPAVVRQRQVPASDAELGRGGGDRARHGEPGAAVGVVDHLAVVPVQADRRTERLGHRLLRREPRGERLGRAWIALLGGALGDGEQPLGQQWRARDGFGEPFHEHNVDADRDDHGSPLGVLTRMVARGSAPARGWRAGR